MKLFFLMMFNAYLVTFLEFEVKSLNGGSQNALGLQNNINQSLINMNKERDLNQSNKIITPDFLKKTENLNLISGQLINQVQNPHTTIKSIDTEILLKKRAKDGMVFEKVKYVLQNGVFNSIIRKVSLAGTADKHFGFRLASADVNLLNAKVVKDCLESSSIYEHPYVCIIANFQPVDATKTDIEVEIEYEYISENLLRKREKPFQNNEEENILVWIYDNNKDNFTIDTIKLSIRFEDIVEQNKIMAYPEKFILKNETESKTFYINWSVKDFKPYTYKNFALNIPLFNQACERMSDLNFELSSGSIVKFFIWLCLSITIILGISYLYFSDKKSANNDDEQVTESEQEDKTEECKTEK